MKTTNEVKSGNKDVKHPQSEEWMAYLYREVSRSERTKLAAHLAECGECQAQVKRWENAMRALDDGKDLAERPR
jgi:anti-sigma factor RsiW